MTSQRKVFFILLPAMIIVSAVIFGAFIYPHYVDRQYRFKEQTDNISAIEIVSAKSSTKYTVLAVVPDEDKQEFLEQFQSIEFGRYIFGDPPCITGTSIKITYTGGNYEIICPEWSEYVKEGKAYAAYWIYCNESVFNELISKYL